MSINFQILGKPGSDNSVFVWINSGTKLYRLLFDCGENLLQKLGNSDVKAIDYLLLSHLHLDHISGFDYFFRRNYDRNKPVLIFGPENTSEIIHHRLRGFTWNLVDNLPGEWLVDNILSNKIITNKFLTKEGYSEKHFVKEVNFNKIIFENEDFKIEAAILNHIIPSIAYRITEKVSFNISKEKLEESNLPQGPYLDKLKDFSISNKENIIVDNIEFNIGELREKLINKSEGDSLSYLTDFIFDDESKGKSINLIKGCKTVICESQYKNEDREFAEKNYHLTTKQAATLAKEAKVEKLILFHISDRYRIETYPELLRQAREIFPETYFPTEWKNI